MRLTFARELVEITLLPLHFRHEVRSRHAAAISNFSESCEGRKERGTRGWNPAEEVSHDFQASVTVSAVDISLERDMVSVLIPSAMLV